jgi:hypothetical protein
MIEEGTIMIETLYSHVDDEQMLRLAEEGQVPKDVLASMLPPDRRKIFLDACAAIERQYASACGSSGDPCLESGCSVDHEHGETCLQPLLRAEAEYLKACGAAWVTLKGRSG